MFGYISLKKKTIFLQDQQFEITEENFKSPNFLFDKYPNVKLWFSDVSELREIIPYRWNVTHCAGIHLISEWDIFEVCNKLTPTQIVQHYNALPSFHPKIKDFSGGRKDELWHFELDDIDLEVIAKNNLSKSNALNIDLDYLDFYLWLAQRNITLPKGKPTESKMKLADILTLDLNFCYYVKREDIERISNFDRVKIKNEHWKEDWIAAYWLKSILFENLNNLEREVSVMQYSEAAPLKIITPPNFNLSWLFCPAALYVIRRYFSYLAKESKKYPNRINLLTFLIGAYILDKSQDIGPNLISEFSLLKWKVGENLKTKEKAFHNRYSQ